MCVSDTSCQRQCCICIHWPATGSTHGWRPLTTSFERNWTLSQRTNSLKRGLSRSNRAISACSLGDLLIIVQTSRVRVGMTQCFHASIMQLLCPFLLKQCRLLWLALSFRLGHATHCVSFAITLSLPDCQDSLACSNVGDDDFIIYVKDVCLFNNKFGKSTLERSCGLVKAWECGSGNG